MKRIPLTQGKFALVDNIDYDYLMQWNWCFNGLYAMRVDGHNGPTVYMHRLIAKRMGFNLRHEVDHKSRNKLNNQRRNLRRATYSNNACNKGPTKANTSGYKGVSWNKRHRQWRARIMINGKSHYLGHFNTPEEAADVYNNASVKYHGPFAYFNKV